MANRYANLTGTNKIKDEWSKINAGFDKVEQEIDAHLADSAGWRNYNSITELGLTEGSETIEQICAAMADKSILRFIKTTSNTSTAYPAISGIFTVIKLASYRTELRFMTGVSGSSREWVGYYDVNITPNFTGWKELINTTDGKLTDSLDFLSTLGIRTRNGNVDSYQQIAEFPEATSSFVELRLFRNTNTTGTKAFTIFAGDGTPTAAFSIRDGEISIINKLGVKITAGNGSPEGVVTANPGSIYLNRSGGAGVSLYVKQSGTGNTGWVAK